MDKHKLKKLFKPLVASSLAFSLVSVASASNAVITGSQTLVSNSTISDANAVANTVEDSKAGLVVEVTTASQSLTMNGNLTIEAINGEAKNAYGILIDVKTTQAFAITATNFKTITIAEPTTTLEDGKAMIYANNSNQVITFTKTGIIAGTDALATSGAVYGIQNNLHSPFFRRHSNRNHSQVN